MHLLTNRQDRRVPMPGPSRRRDLSRRLRLQVGQLLLPLPLHLPHLSTQGLGPARFAGANRPSQIGPQLAKPPFKLLHLRCHAGTVPLPVFARKFQYWPVMFQRVNRPAVPAVFY